MYCHPNGYAPLVNLSSVLDSITGDPVVTVDEFKTYAKVDGDEEDSLIGKLIEAATNEAENYTRRAIRIGDYVSKTDRFHYTLSLDAAPADATGIVVKYFDSLNAEQTLNPNQYTIKDLGPDEFLQIIFDGTSLPTIYDRWDAVKIEFSAGYTIVPGRIKTWILEKAASFYENRQDQVVGNVPSSVYGYGPLMSYRML